MKPIFLIGLVVVILGLALLVVPIPHMQEQGFHAGGVSVGVTTEHDRTVSPIFSAVMIVGGAVMMIAQKAK